MINGDERNELRTEGKGSRKWILLCVPVVIIVAAIIGISIYNAPANRLSRQLDLGQKYLVEKNYEQAIVEFDKAIAIDPMNVEAYLGKADACVGMGDYENAIAALQKGYELTGDERLQALMAEIQGEIAEREAAEEARKKEEEKNKLLDLGFSIEDFYVAGYKVYEADFDVVAAKLNADDKKEEDAYHYYYHYQYPSTPLGIAYGLDGGSVMAQGLLKENNWSLEIYGGGYLNKGEGIVEYTPPPPCIEAPISHGDSIEGLLAISGNVNTTDGAVNISLGSNPRGEYVVISYIDYGIYLFIYYKDHMVDFWDMTIF